MGVRSSGGSNGSIPQTARHLIDRLLFLCSVAERFAIWLLSHLFSERVSCVCNVIHMYLPIRTATRDIFKHQNVAAESPVG